MKLPCAKILLTLSILVLSPYSNSRDHLIYTVAEDIPMGYENEVIKKNYYINMGVEQGIKQGTVLDVFRVISKSNPCYHTLDL